MVARKADVAQKKEPLSLQWNTYFAKVGYCWLDFMCAKEGGEETSFCDCERTKGLCGSVYAGDLRFRGVIAS